MSTDTSRYVRTDYTELAREFGCHLRIGRYGIRFFMPQLNTTRRKVIAITPLDGWITDKNVVAHIIRENGNEL